jgi:pseudouridine-5'-phosphate glycosidase
LQSGILIANPIPETDALPAADIEAGITATCRADRSIGQGSHALPAGAHQRTDRRPEPLVKNNAALAAQICVEYAAVPKT